MLAASVCGTSHEKRGQPCQDAHHWAILPDGALVAAVADGAGSALLGEAGAPLAVEKAVDAVRRRQAAGPWPGDADAWDSLLTDALGAARSAIEEEAARRDVVPRDLATTLILVVATARVVAVGQVGDGAAVADDGAGNLLALTALQRGEYVNHTTFLTSPDALATAQLAVWEGSAARLAVLSDGLQSLAMKMPEGTPHGPFFAPLLRFVAETTDEVQGRKQLMEFLRAPRISQRAEDDLTLLLAARL